MNLQDQADSDGRAPVEIPTARTKHAELSASLRAAIATGKFKVGDKLPTESQFVQSTPYSLGTIQRAIRTLVEEGLVERKPKLGTFVARPRKMIDRPWHFRFLDADRKTPLPVYPTVVGRALVRQRGPWSDYLKGQLLRIDRMVNVNDEFSAFSRFFVDQSRFAVFHEIAIDALNGENFRVLLNRQIGSPIQHISHRLYCSRPAPDVSRRLGISLDQVCSIVEIAASLKDRDFVYFQELTVPPSDRRLELADPHSNDYVD